MEDELLDELAGEPVVDVDWYLELMELWGISPDYDLEQMLPF